MVDTGEARHRAPVWLQWLALLVLMTALSMALVARFAPAQQALSRADEYVYIDSLEKATEWGVAQRGERVGQYAVELAACRGISEHGPIGSPCGGPYDWALAPYSGVTSADVHSPVYFYLTAFPARLLMATPFVDDLLIAGRLVSGLWLALGLVGIVACARALDASWTAGLAVALLVLVAPITRWTNTYVTPDSMNLVLGSAVSLAAINLVRGHWPVPVLVGASTIVALVKVPNVLVVGAAAVFLLLQAWTSRGDRRQTRRLAVGAVASVVAAVGAQAVWLYIRSVSALGPPADQGLQPSAQSFVAVVARESTALLSGVLQGPDPVLPGLYRGRVVSWLMVAGLIAVALFAVGGESVMHRDFAWGTLTAFLTGGPLLHIALRLAGAVTYELPPRYALCLVPGMAAVTAYALHRRSTAVAAAVLGALGCAQILVSAAW